jgi:hypothetical protein
MPKKLRNYTVIRFKYLLIAAGISIIGSAIVLAFLIKSGDLISTNEIIKNSTKEFKLLHSNYLSHLTFEQLADTLDVAKNDYLYNSVLQKLISGKEISQNHLNVVLRLTQRAQNTFPSYFNSIDIFNSSSFIRIIIAGITFLFSATALYLFYISKSSLDTYQVIKNPEEYFHNYKIDATIAKTLEKVFKTHDIISQGVYNNYPTQFSDKILDLKTSKTVSKVPGVMIWIKECEVQQYAEVAMRLLEGASHSVYSTTIFGVDSFMDYLMDSNTKVSNWLYSCEVKKMEFLRLNEHFQIKRTQLVQENDWDEFLQMHIDNYNNHKQNLLKYYRYYASELVCDHYRIYKIRKNASNIYYGESIIFDEKIFIQYDQPFKILKIHFGKIVEEFVHAFKHSSANDHKVSGLNRILKTNSTLYDDYKKELERLKDKYSITKYDNLEESEMNRILDLFNVKTKYRKDKINNLAKAQIKKIYKKYPYFNQDESQIIISSLTNG